MDRKTHVVSEFCKLPAPYAANKKTIAIVVVGNFATSGHLKIKNIGLPEFALIVHSRTLETAGVCTLVTDGSRWICRSLHTGHGRVALGPQARI